MMLRFRVFFIGLLCSFVGLAQPDVQVLDEIIAVVGNEIILFSDLEGQKGQYLASGNPLPPDADCRIMESLLYENLMLNRAKVDSIEVSPDMVEGELDRRIQQFSIQMGGPEKLEAFYGKSITEIRREFYDAIESQLRIQRMQQSIMSGIAITPADVERFYQNIPEDSIPLIESEVEVSQILIKPEPDQSAIESVKKKLEGYREEVKEGRDFSTLAVLYSEDPGSATRGGELGLVGRGTMVPEFEQVAYNLDEGQVSHVFESDFGFHIMQMIERKGDLYNARHILLKPKVGSADLQLARQKLEEIRAYIMSDSLSFEQAASEYSNDEGTKNNNGIMINPNTGSIRFNMKEIDPSLFLLIDKMKVGEISEPSLMSSNQGEKAYRLVKLRFRSDAHKADLVEDYQLLQEMTRSSLTDEAVADWLKKTIDKTYIRIDGELGQCSFENDWSKSR